MPCRLSALIPALVAGALVGAGVAWAISMAEWMLTGNQAVFGLGRPGYIALALAGAVAIAIASTRRGAPRGACADGSPDAG